MRTKQRRGGGLLSHAAIRWVSAASVLAAAGCGSATSPASPPASGRDPWVQPFIATSIWNTAIGSGAHYSPDSAAPTADLRASPAVLNSGMWSVPAYLATSKDPVVTVTTQEGTQGHPNEGPFRINASSQMLPDPSSDAHLSIVDPSHSFSTDLYGATINADGSISAVRGWQVDLYGDGAKLYGTTATHDIMMRGFGGLVRVAELQALRIPHATTMSLSQNRLKHGPVWPGTADDYCAYLTPSCYTGSVPIGSLIAIVSSADVTTLGLTPAGLAFARCLQDYGAYVDDSGGSDQITFYAEDATAGMPQIADIEGDLAKIQPYLAAVTNNTAQTMGGGGTPRQPPPPPLRGASS
jgi:hypothetical protein